MQTQKILSIALLVIVECGEKLVTIASFTFKSPFEMQYDMTRMNVDN